jgi:hypothetical protein
MTKYFSWACYIKAAFKSPEQAVSFDALSWPMFQWSILLKL